MKEQKDIGRIVETTVGYEYIPTISKEENPHVEESFDKASTLLLAAVNAIAYDDKMSDKGKMELAQKFEDVFGSMVASKLVLNHLRKTFGIGRDDDESEDGKTCDAANDATVKVKVTPDDISEKLDDIIAMLKGLNDDD